MSVLSNGLSEPFPQGNTTGKESVYTKYGNLEIMFHVAPMLPWYPNDKQQVCACSPVYLLPLFLSMLSSSTH